MTAELRHIAPRKNGAPEAALAETFLLLEQRLTALHAGATPVPFSVPEGSALAILRQIFQLDLSELELLALAAGLELDNGIRDAVRNVSPTGQLDTDFAAQMLGSQAWVALCPGAPLRHWRLVEGSGVGPVRDMPFRIDERVLHFLIGNVYLDARLDGVVHTQWALRDKLAAPSALVSQISDSWSSPTAPRPLILLAGTDTAAKRMLFVQVMDGLALRPFRMDAADIPVDWAQRTTLATLIDRELALSSAALLLDCGPRTDDAAVERAGAFADLLSGPTVVSARDPAAAERTPRLRIELPGTERAERRGLWRSAVGAHAEALGPVIERMSQQFSLDRSSITAAANLAPFIAGEHPEQHAARLWKAAREQGRQRLDGLAERMDTKAGWSDLVLPAEQSETLHDLAGHLRAAWRVHEDWGWAEKSARGLGAAALFSGPSGTGKTLAAEVLAAELDLDLYRIDLSQIVSKYIGETEKNLARIFDAAEDAGAILLFDEADALFGKRSEVKDSHDRYANVEVSYLLQRMEAYRGLAVLTTNLKSAVDQAFLRRLRYVVVFPFPDATARADIWARVLPEKTPREGLDFQRLSRLNLTGGSIRSVALNAAFLASGRDEPLRMTHILRAARREYSKLEKPFTPTEMEAFR